MLNSILALVAATVVAAILFAGASHKLRAPHRFARQLEDYALLPGGLVGFVARLLPAAELMTAVALLLASTRGAGALAAALLLCAYTIAIAINLARGHRDIDCGCSGPGLTRPLGGTLIVRNLVLLALVGVATLPATGSNLSAFGLFLVGACTAASLIIYVAIEGLLANQPHLKSLSGD